MPPDFRHPGIPLSHPLFRVGDMTTQLVLLDSGRRSWKLDRQTREIGKRGVAQAREALRRAGTPDPGDPKAA
jgi:hypothetical protein